MGTSIALVVGDLVVLEIVISLMRLVIGRAPTIRWLQLLSRSKRALRALVALTGAERVRFVAPRTRSSFQEVADIFSGARSVIAVSEILIDLTESRFDITESDNRRARRVHAQLRMMRRIITVIIVVIAILAALTSFAFATRSHD